VSARLLAALALLLAGCASPLGGEDLELSTGLSGSPGLGLRLGFAQRLHAGAGGRVDFQTEVVHQRLDEATRPDGEVGDELDLVRVGLRWRATPAESSTWGARAGIVWLRARGDVGPLDGTGDFGGVFLGAEREWRLGRHLATGPGLVLHLVDSEGDGDSGLLAEAAWVLVWRL